MLVAHPDRRVVAHKQQATMYYRGGYGIVEEEVREILIEIGPYAQYTAAVFVSYVPRGGRKARAFVQTYQPSVTILEGWGHANPDDPMLPLREVSEGVSVSRGRYTSCDPRWDSDFDAKLGAYLSERGLSLAADMRGHDPQPR